MWSPGPSFLIYLALTPWPTFVPLRLALSCLTETPRNFCFQKNVFSAKPPVNRFSVHIKRSHVAAIVAVDRANRAQHPYQRDFQTITLNKCFSCCDRVTWTHHCGLDVISVLMSLETFSGGGGVMFSKRSWDIQPTSHVCILFEEKYCLWS